MTPTPDPKRRVWTVEQKAKMLAELDAGTPIGQVAKKHQINTSSLYYWQKLRAAAQPTVERPQPGATQVATREVYVDVSNPSYEQLLRENQELRDAVVTLSLLLSKR